MAEDPDLDARLIAERYLAAANAHDVSGMAALWEPGGRENFPTFQQSFRVPDEFRGHFDSLFRSFPDVGWDVVSLVGDGEIVVVRSKMHGTHMGPYQGLSGTGKKFAVDTVDFMQIRDGRIISNDVIFDGVTVLRQLGMLPPAGSRREQAMQRVFNVFIALKSSRALNRFRSR